ncbi:MAG: hypothetical protein GY856_42865, partial [bacterium]|nr:hypothetical protein [bacterium]
DQGVASADEFIAWALRFFGDPDPTAGGPWERGVRLAGLVRSHRSLLILDGLEPLQYPPGEMAGRLRDQAVQSLLRELAATSNGLCMITTRLPVSDLDDFAGSGLLRVDLGQLDDAAGAELLRSLDVKGSDDELRIAVNDLGGHALALTLFGTYLRDVHEGDLRCRVDLPGLMYDEEQGGHARRVMTSYERWLGDDPALAILRLLGLFDRPAAAEAIAALRHEPAIPDLTDRLLGLADRGWRQALARLRRARLIARTDPSRPGTLDAHPLVREHFADQLQQESPEAWREGNSRLYEHFKTTAKELPETLDEMAPLYAAVTHGCRAGRYQEALDDVFWARIRRRDQAFTIHKLGAFGSDLAAISGFFDPPWSRPVPTLGEGDRAFLLNEAGFSLRALGRLAEATEPMRAGLDVQVAQEDWKNAAVVAANLSQLKLILGDVPQAVADANQAVELAERSGDTFQPILRRTNVADALHQAGRIDDAEAAFREAETMQKKRQPEYPLLYSLQGYRYCDLLLGKGRFEEVLARASKTITIAIRNTWPLDIGLDHLALGRAHLMQVLRTSRGELEEARSHLDQAVGG